MRVARWGLMILAVGLGGCPKSEDGNKAAPSASASARKDPNVGASAAPQVSDSGSAASDSGSSTGTSAKAASYSGTYSLTPAPMYIPATKDWNNVKQAKDDPSKHVGEGKLSLEVDANGRVSGTLDAGPAAPAVIDGSLVNGEIRGVVRRKDPADEGLTGTFVGTLSGDEVSGTIALAESNAAIVREGKLSLRKK